MIAHKYKLIYVHINKTGGTSIESMFGKFNDQITAKEIRRKVGNKVWDEYYKFSTVRNPWDRMVSEYHFRKTSHIINPQKWQCPVHLRIKDTSFRDWILQDHNEQRSEHIRFRSQIKWLLDQNGELLVDFICRFENLNRDFAEVCKAINQNWELPHYNKTKHLHYSQYYDNETMQIVGERHKEDIEYFGYKFEGINYL